MQVFKENYYQKKLEKYLNGKHTRFDIGISDVTNEEMHAEIKIWCNWKQAINQLLLYNAANPRRILCIYLFGTTTDKMRELAYKYIPIFKIVIYELKHVNDRLTILQNNKIIHTFEEDDYIENRIIIKEKVAIIKEHTTTIKQHIFNCDRCGYSTNKLSDIKRHIVRKSPCEPIVSDISLDSMKEKYLKEKLINHMCDVCDKGFSSKSGYYIHRKNCKKEENIIDLKDQVKQLQKIVEQSKKNIKQFNKIININNFNQEKTDYIDPEFIKNCLKDKNMIQLIEKIYFDPNHPENHNVRIKNMNKNLLEYYNNKKWIIATKDQVIKDMINSGYNVFKIYYENNDEIDQWLDLINKEETKLFKELRSKIMLVILNNK